MMVQWNKKKAFVLSLVVITILSTAFLHAQKIGDVNHNQKIDIVDALLVAQYYVGQNPPGFHRDVADANRDNKIDIIDSLMIAKFYVGLLDHLAEPSSQPSQSPGPEPEMTAKPGGGSPFIIGFDASEGGKTKAEGVKFKDLNGKVKPVLKIFKDLGYSWARVRLMKDPEGKYGLFQDLEYVKAMARDIKKQGLKFLLDIHYSHWWADPANQRLPPAWKNLDLSQLQKQVYNYTSDVIKKLREQGTLPHMVQIGNETDSGMLWESGRNTNWEQYTSLTNAAANAIKDASGSSMPKIMMHIAKGGDAEGTLWWLENFLKHNGWIDALGLSYYPQWHGTLKDLESNLKKIRKKYKWLDVYVVETAYFWMEWKEEPPKLSFTHSVQGQYDFLRALRKTVEPTGCKGIFYWGGLWTQSSQTLQETDYRETFRRSLFDDKARAVKGIRGLVD